MKVTAVFKCCFPLTLFVLFVVTGCASDSSTQPDGQQGSPGMNRGKGMGHGGKGGPPGVDKIETTVEPQLPVEAFAACEGKNPGDTVEFTLPDVGLVQATCKVVDDHLVAVPSLPNGRP